MYELKLEDAGTMADLWFRLEIQNQASKPNETQ